MVRQFFTSLVLTAALLCELHPVETADNPVVYFQLCTVDSFQLAYGVPCLTVLDRQSKRCSVKISGENLSTLY